MAHWEVRVLAVYRDIQNLPSEARDYLWKMLRQSFPGALDGTNPMPREVWDYPQNGFGKSEIRLLKYLCGRGECGERTVLKHLWPEEWPATVKREEVLRRRLRKREQRIKEKLLKLHSDWNLSRPRRRHLKLSRSES
jgi:hypothetical protein